MPWYAVSWWVLVLGGLASVFVAALSVDSPRRGEVGALTGIGVIAVWVLYGGVTFYHRGLRRRVAKHLGSKWDEGELLTQPVPRYMRADLALALAAADPLAQRYGVRPSLLIGTRRPTSDHYESEDYPPDDLITFFRNNPFPQAITYTRLPRSGRGETVKVAENVAYFLTVAGHRAVVLAAPARLEVLARTPDAAQAVMDHLLAEARGRSLYRGQVIALKAAEKDEAGFLIEFHDLPAVSRDELVLPADVLTVLDRNVSGWLAKTDALTAAGLRAGHGVLLHGPPGTGKSLAVRYLAGSVPGATVVLLTGRQVKLVRESCRLARLLAPAVLVLEDVDLIATDREQSRDTTLLHDLMDELDGLGPRAAVVTLLTTNRPQVVERALAVRPGRVDQAVAFALPDAELREKLIRVFGRKLDLSAVDVPALVARTDGASPAFLGDLVRKAVVLAAERGEPARLTDADVTAAVRELVEVGGELTRNLLGYRATRLTAPGAASAGPLPAPRTPARVAGRSGPGSGAAAWPRTGSSPACASG